MILAPELHIHGRIVDNASSSSTEFFPCDVVILVNADKSISHKYVVENGSNTLTVMSEISGYSLPIANKNVSKGTLKSLMFFLLFNLRVLRVY